MKLKKRMLQSFCKKKKAAAPPPPVTPFFFVRNLKTSTTYVFCEYECRFCQVIGVITIYCDEPNYVSVTPDTAPAPTVEKMWHDLGEDGQEFTTVQIRCTCECGRGFRFDRDGFIESLECFEL